MQTLWSPTPSSKRKRRKMREARARARSAIIAYSNIISEVGFIRAMIKYERNPQKLRDANPDHCRSSFSGMIALGTAK